MHRLAKVLLAALSCALLLGAAPAQAAIDSFFDVFLEGPMAGPPYPTQPVITIVGNWIDGSIAPTGNTKMGLAGADNGTPEGEFSASCLARGGGGGGGGWQVDSFFDVFYLPQPGWPDPPPDSFFDVFYEVRPAGGGGGGGGCALVTRDPAYPPEDARRYFDVHHIDSFFDIFYTVDDGLGLQDLHLHGVCQGVTSFFDVFVELTPGHPVPESFFDVFIELSCPTSIDPALPLFTITTTGTFIQHPTPAESTTWGRIKSLYGG